MTGAEHRAKAVEYLRVAETTALDARTWELTVALAQVHATLALSADDSDPARAEQPS